MKRFLLIFLLTVFLPILGTPYVPLKMKIVRPYDLEGVKTFEMNTQDFPKSTNALLRITRMDAAESQFPVFIDEKGDVHQRINDNGGIIQMTFGGYGYGEFAFVSIVPAEEQFRSLKDCSVVAVEKVTPFPLKVKNKLGQTCELRPLEPTGKHFELFLKGFEPNEEITFQSFSGDELMKQNTRLSPKGDGVIDYIPAVIGFKEGAFEVTITGQKGCPLVLRHVWGDIAFTPVDKYEDLKKRFSSLFFKSP